jgi:hypothetical protein
MPKKTTPEENIFTHEMEKYIEKGTPLNEQDIDLLTYLYCDYLKSYGEFVRAMHARQDFKLALIFATKINLKNEIPLQ